MNYIDTIDGNKMLYETTGTCSRAISFELKDGKVHNAVFYGGCNGNLQGIGRLVEGMDAEECIRKLDGIRCGWKSTSCPDQLANALRMVGHDMKLKDYRDTGHVDHQLPPSWWIDN